MNVFVSEQEKDPDWDRFVAGAPCGHHVQTSLWAQVKSTLGYTAKRIIVRENGQIVAGGQLLVKRFAPLLAVGYMPKGPVCLDGDPGVGEAFLDRLERVVRTDRLRLLAVQPAHEDPELLKALLSRGFHPGWLEVSPTATILLDLAPDCERLLGQMKRQTRQNVRRAEREGITVREGTASDLPAFYQLHLLTSQRQRFDPYPEKYFSQMWHLFSAQGLIGLVLAEYQESPVSALLIVPFRDTVIAKTLGWSGEHGEKRPNDAVFWAAVQWAKAHGYHTFDFEGIDRRGAELVLAGQSLPEDLRRSPDFFKLGFGGQVALLPTPLELIPNRVFRWPYRQVFGETDHGRAANDFLARVRRRFG